MPKPWVGIVSGAGCALLLSACAVQHRPKSQFAGKLTSSNPACPQTQGTLIIQNGQVVFTPADTTWTLQGPVVGDRIALEHSRPSFDHKTYRTVLTATLSGDRVTGNYTTPSCTYAVDLAKF